MGKSRYTTKKVLLHQQLDTVKSFNFFSKLRSIPLRSLFQQKRLVPFPGIEPGVVGLSDLLYQ